MEKNCPNFLYTLYTARRKSESLFSYSFLAFFPSLVMQRISSFILLSRFDLKKNAYALLVFLNQVPYMQLSHIIPGVNIMAEN